MYFSYFLWKVKCICLAVEETNFSLIQLSRIYYWLKRFSSSPPYCCIHASVNWISIGSGNGLSPIRHQAITWTNAHLLSIGSFGTNFSEIRIKIQTFYSWKCIWKHRLLNCGFLSRRRSAKRDFVTNASGSLRGAIDDHNDIVCYSFNTLRPRQNGRHFADDTFKRIFLNENVEISIQISLKFVPKGPINNNPALVQIMAWRRSGDKPLSEQMMVSLPTHICFTRPQWDKFQQCPYKKSKSILLGTLRNGIYLNLIENFFIVTTTYIVHKIYRSQGTFVTVESYFRIYAETQISHTIMITYYGCKAEMVPPGLINDNKICRKQKIPW